jgi:hypothetical protein
MLLLLGYELLWRNNINPARDVMGLGFYARILSWDLFLMTHIRVKLG